MADYADSMSGGTSAGGAATPSKTTSVAASGSVKVKDAPLKHQGVQKKPRWIKIPRWS